MPPPTRTLPDEIVEEIFLRLPPNEPDCVVRASLASKLWLGRLTSPRFHARRSEFHGAAPMLGFVYSCLEHSGPADQGPIRRFFSTTKFGARVPDHDLRGWNYDAWDCRHGRVLLGGARSSPNKFVIWNPATGGWTELYPPKTPTPERYRTYAAAVFCSVTGCDHHACHDGHFRVLLVCRKLIAGGCVAFAQVSLPHSKDVGSDSCSRLDKWSEPCSESDFHLPGDALVDLMPPVLIQDALYFMIFFGYDYEDHDDDDDDDDNYEDDDDDGDYDDYDHCTAILKYDLASNCLSLIVGPLEDTLINGNVILMKMEDGSLGFARVNKLTLYLWSKNMGSDDGVALWTACRVIDLQEFIPIQNPKEKLSIIGSMEGSDVVFVATDLGIYEICLKTLRWKKTWNSAIFLTLIPYTSFYNPRGSCLASKIAG